MGALLGEFFRGGWRGEFSRRNVQREGLEVVSSACPDPNAGLQVSACSHNDIGHIDLTYTQTQRDSSCSVML